jgi:hypothetical protein
MKHVSVKCAEGYRGSAGITILANGLVQLWIKTDRSGEQPPEIRSYELSHDERDHFINVLVNSTGIAEVAGILTTDDDE